MTAEVIQDASMAVKKALIERALEGELSHTLGYAPGAAKPEDARDHRNGGAGDTGTPRSDPVRIEVLVCSGRVLRAAADLQARAALHRLRGQDRGHSRARHDGARAPRLPG